MSVQVIKAQFVTIMKQVTQSYNPSAPLTANQLRTVYDVIPRVIQDADLPGLVIWPDAAVYDQSRTGATMVKEDRIYNLDYLYSRIDVGTVGESETAEEQVITTIRDWILARPGLWDTEADLPGTVEFDSTPLGDSGYTEIKYGSNLFVGTRYRVRVVSIDAVQYVD